MHDHFALLGKCLRSKYTGVNSYCQQVLLTIVSDRLLPLPCCVSLTALDSELGCKY